MSTPNPVPELPTTRRSTSAQVLRYIATAGRPVGIRELAAAFPVHENAIRKHLRRLRDEGLLIESTDRRGTTGRPRLTWELDPTHDDPRTDGRHYEVLSRLLVEVTNGRPAREVGTDYGRDLVRSQPHRDPLELLVDVMRRHGFEPEARHGEDGVEVVLHQCPFATAATAGAVVCELHLGIAEGVTAGGPHPMVTGLSIAPPHMAGCRIHTHQEEPGLSPAAPAEEAHP